MGNLVSTSSKWNFFIARGNTKQEQVGNKEDG